MTYLTPSQFAAREGVSESRVIQWLHGGRLKGAQLVGKRWIIPGYARRPEAMRPWGRKGAMA